jgi:hypothetical protein
MMDELMRLIAQLNVLVQSPRKELIVRPSASEIDRFLLNYSFELADVVIEKIEITKNGIFEFYMFAIWHKRDDDVRIVTMWPKENAPESQWT